MIATATTEPTFLYPKSRQFPFDEVCEQIVRALEERNWSVPGITVDFDVYGTGAQKYRTVRHIRGDGFKLWFCRPQARMGNWNDTAAVTEIIIPQKELHVYEDESGPTYYVYVGKDWDSDKEQFLNGSKVNSKLSGKPRTYLKYKAGCDCRATAGASFSAMGFFDAWLGQDAKKLAALNHTHPGRRSPMLVHDNDLDREYEPKSGEATSYRTNDVFTEFTRWLEDNLLAQILAQPVPDEKVDFFREAVTPYADTVGPIFCFGEGKDAQRVHQGKLDINELPLGERYGLIGSGNRLLNQMVRNDGTIPDVAYDGFQWCGIGEITGETPINTLTVPGHYSWSDRERFVFRITPTRADGIYVADHAPYEKRREELFEEIKPRDRLTDAELAEADRARARTIVPVAEYAGGYEQPVVLVNRELDFDEVELVSGPWPECQYVALIANRSPEAHQLLEQALSAQEAYYRHYGDDTRDARGEAIAKLADHFTGDPELAAAAEAYSRHTFRKVEVNAHFIERLVSAAGESRRLGLI